jgi:hypothetical protein
MVPYTKHGGAIPTSELTAAKLDALIDILRDKDPDEVPGA